MPSKEELLQEIKKKLDYKVVNIVATIDTGRKLDLKAIYSFLQKNAHRIIGDVVVNYEPERFPGLIIKKIQLPDKSNMSMLLFSSGKIVVTGAKRISHTEQAVEILKKLFKEMDIELEIEPRVFISNIVLKGDLGVPLNIEKILINLPNVIYEPELFPGTIVKLEKKINDKTLVVTYLLFNTGKFVCTGIKDEKVIPIAMDMLIETIVDIMSSEEVEEEEEEIELEI